MRSDHERLQDILEAIVQVEKYAIRGQEAFQQDELFQIWIVVHQASNSLSEELLMQYPEIPWAAVVEFRNVLIHEYFRVNLEIVWRIVERDLPNLRATINTMMQKKL